MFINHVDFGIASHLPNRRASKNDATYMGGMGKRERNAINTYTYI